MVMCMYVPVVIVLIFKYMHMQNSKIFTQWCAVACHNVHSCHLGYKWVCTQPYSMTCACILGNDCLQFGSLVQYCTNSVYYAEAEFGHVC